MTRPERSIDGLADQSVLFVSVVTHPDHPLHAISRRHLHAPPDLDLAAYVGCIGPWVRRYFAEHVIDGATAPLPKNLSGYKGVVIGCTLHSFNEARAPLAPWQGELVAFARQVIEAGLPFYGCCGGAYAGHLALGGKLAPNLAGPGLDPASPGSVVIRTSAIELTERGQSDPLLRGLPPRFGMNAIHSDYVADLAPGCEALAHAADIPNQLIAYGPQVRLLPGMHPELTTDVLRKQAPAFVKSGRFGTSPTNTDGMLALLENLSDTPHANQHLLVNFLSEFCAPYAA